MCPHRLFPASLQDSSGISRDEMAVALMEVSEGRIPTDRIALRELCREISQWPALDEPTGVPVCVGAGWAGQCEVGGGVYCDCEQPPR
jgi:hypothetical protein